MSTYLEASSFDPNSHKKRANYLDLTDPNSSKRLRTSIATPINGPQQACSKPHLLFHKVCANIALDYYNNKNDTTFEIVEDEALDSSPFADSSGSWIHCSFNAKEDSSIHNFFAELQYVLPSGPVVTTCEILIQGETQIGCDNCKSVTHPVFGYRRSLVNMNHALLAMLDDDTLDNLVAAIQYAGETLSNANRKHNEICAKIALDYYNNQNHTKFELVAYDTVATSPYVDLAGTLIHCFFLARDSSIKPFFAEIQYISPLGPAVTTCKILIEGETKLGCESCRTGVRFPVLHPVDFSSGNLATTIDDPGEALSKARKSEICANIALEYYNKLNHIKFELVVDDTMAINPFVDFSGFWIHCCFRAQYSSTKLFFAEIQHVYPTGPAVTTCKILEGETRVGCPNCFSVTHPIVGCRGGNIYRELAGYPRFPDPPTFNPVPNFDPVAWRERNCIHGEKFANRALDHYNKINVTEFAFVNDNSIEWYRFSETWIHISFNAIDSSAVKLFFAEMKYDKFSEPAVTICKIVEGETKYGCEHCHYLGVKHPVVGYRGDFLVATEIDEKDRDSCYKVYCEEFLNETYVESEAISHS